MKTNAVLEIPETEGIKYAGSKLRLLPHILRLAGKVKGKSVFDAFAGTTRVSQAFAQTGWRVVANDRAVWSGVFAECYLKNTREENFYSGILDHLNNLPPKDGWFTEHYGGLALEKRSVGGDGLKKPWQIHNTRRLDAIRDEIDRLDLEETEKNVLLTSLILALDRVDSTIGHHAAYLNEWSPRSFKPLKLKVPRLFRSNEDHRVLCGDVFDSIDKADCDLAYFDPPYGSNNEKMPPSRVRYAAYYHLWTSVVLNDKPQVFGKAKRRADTSDAAAGSVFEEFRRAANGGFIATAAIEKLLAKTTARYIILSYSSGGRATAGELFEIIENAGRMLEFVKVDYRQNVMASMRWTNDWTRADDKPNREYLFLIEK